MVGANDSLSCFVFLVVKYMKDLCMVLKVNEGISNFLWSFLCICRFIITLPVQENIGIAMKFLCLVVLHCFSSQNVKKSEPSTRLHCILDTDYHYKFFVMCPFFIISVLNLNNYLHHRTWQINIL